MEREVARNLSDSFPSSWNFFFVPISGTLIVHHRLHSASHVYRIPSGDQVSGHVRRNHRRQFPVRCCQIALCNSVFLLESVEVTACSRSCNRFFVDFFPKFRFLGVSFSAWQDYLLPLTMGRDKVPASNPGKVFSKKGHTSANLEVA